MPRFTKSVRFKELGIDNRPLPNYPSNHTKGGHRMMKPLIDLQRDSYLRGSLKSGYYRREEKCSLNAEIGYLEMDHIGRSLPSLSLKQRAASKAPPHPKEAKNFSTSDMSWGREQRFRCIEQSCSPGPVYFPHVSRSSLVKRDTKEVPSWSAAESECSGMAMIRRGPGGLQMVKSRSRDRALFLTAKLDANGYMYRTEDAGEMASVGHAADNDVTNQDILSKVRPSTAGLGKGVRFPEPLWEYPGPGPKYNPSHQTDSRKSRPLSYRFATRWDRKEDRIQTMRSGIIHRGIVLHRPNTAMNDIGPGYYAPKRLFDDAKKSSDLGFGEAQLQWLIKKKKLEDIKAKALRVRRKKSRKKIKKKGRGLVGSSWPNGVGGSGPGSGSGSGAAGLSSRASSPTPKGGRISLSSISASGVQSAARSTAGQDRSVKAAAD
ncbi:hypothetical protein AAMO2058_001679900 [Amorphochlora amoebiformis]